jgi:hypothetical protein
MSLIGVALIVLALIVLFLMRARRGVSKLMDQPFLNSMAAAAISGLIAVGMVMVVAGFSSR